MTNTKGQPYAPIKIPEGADFGGMVVLKGQPDIGDQINKKIIAPLAAANQQLSQSDFPDFNDAVKLADDFGVAVCNFRLQLRAVVPELR